MSKKRKTRAEKIRSAEKWEKQKKELLLVQSLQDEYQMHLDTLKKLQSRKNAIMMRRTLAWMLFATGISIYSSIGAFSKEKMQNEINFIMEEENNVNHNQTEWYNLNYGGFYFRPSIDLKTNQIWIEFGKNNGNKIEVINRVSKESLEEELTQMENNDIEKKAIVFLESMLAGVLLTLSEAFIGYTKYENDCLIQEEQEELTLIKDIINT